MEYIGAGAFSQCINLSSIYLQTIREIDRGAFNYCSKLSRIYIRTNYIPSLLSSDAFLGTPIQTSTYTGSYGSIYVYSSMLSQFKSASVWSYYSARMVVN